MSPRLIRNRLVFDEWVFIRSNFGMELRAGNRESGFAHINQTVFHMAIPEELELLKALGKPDYDRDCRARAMMP